MRVYVGPGVDFSGSVEGRLLEPAELCDLLKGVILISCCIIMNYVDVSMMYHLIRGQAIIKLYIFFNMLEVGNIRRSRGRAGLQGLGEEGSIDLTRLSSKQELRCLRTRKPLAYRESTCTNLSVSCPYEIIVYSVHKH